MEKGVTHRVLVFVLIVIVLLPFAVQAAHAYQDHDHKVCSAQDVKHIHNQDIDCSVFHFQIRQEAFNLAVTYTFNDFQIISETSERYIFPDYHTFLISKSSRGPPHFILA